MVIVRVYLIYQVDGKDGKLDTRSLYLIMEGKRKILANKAAILYCNYVTEL